MDFCEWLDGERGRQLRVAEYFDVTPSAVSQWRRNGVPRDKIAQVHELTKRAVSIASLLEQPDRRTAA